MNQQLYELNRDIFNYIYNIAATDDTTDHEFRSARDPSKCLLIRVKRDAGHFKTPPSKKRRFEPLPSLDGLYTDPSAFSGRSRYSTTKRSARDPLDSQLTPNDSARRIGIDASQLLPSPVTTSDEEPPSAQRSSGATSSDCHSNDTRRDCGLTGDSTISSGLGRGDQSGSVGVIIQGEQEPQRPSTDGDSISGDDLDEAMAAISNDIIDGSSNINQQAEQVTGRNINTQPPSTTTSRVPETFVGSDEEDDSHASIAQASDEGKGRGGPDDTVSVDIDNDGRTGGGRNSPRTRLTSTEAESEGEANIEPGIEASEEVETGVQDGVSGRVGHEMEAEGGPEAQVQAGSELTAAAQAVQGHSKMKRRLKTNKAARESQAREHLAKSIRHMVGAQPDEVTIDAALYAGMRAVAQEKVYRQAPLNDSKTLTKAELKVFAWGASIITERSRHDMEGDLRVILQKALNPQETSLSLPFTDPAAGDGPSAQAISDRIWEDSRLNGERLFTELRYYEGVGAVWKTMLALTLVDIDHIHQFIRENVRKVDWPQTKAQLMGSQEPLLASRKTGKKTPATDAEINRRLRTATRWGEVKRRFGEGMVVVLSMLNCSFMGDQGGSKPEMNALLDVLQHNRQDLLAFAKDLQNPASIISSFLVPAKGGQRRSVVQALQELRAAVRSYRTVEPPDEALRLQSTGHSVEELT